MTIINCKIPRVISHSIPHINIRSIAHIINFKTDQQTEITPIEYCSISNRTNFNLVQLLAIC